MVIKKHEWFLRCTSVIMRSNFHKVATHIDIPLIISFFFCWDVYHFQAHQELYQHKYYPLQVKKGHFSIPVFIPTDVQEMIKGMITVDPGKRITVEYSHQTRNNDAEVLLPYFAVALSV